MTSIQMKRIKKKVDFFQQIPVFAAMSRRNVWRFIEKMTKKQFIHNQVVYKEGMPANSVFIVISGEFEQ